MSELNHKNCKASDVTSVLIRSIRYKRCLEAVLVEEHTSVPTIARSLGVTRTIAEVTKSLQL